jgi:hypothetical protein
MSCGGTKKSAQYKKAHKIAKAVIRDDGLPEESAFKIGNAAASGRIRRHKRSRRAKTR